ncbi:hypothetical protein [Nitrosomonas mobilis]|uniref:Uncharacterized protein n=1 Tax=Nitrosomonas mobilis TaxID=51642 RepID=A0A1G5SDP1_9PROT|nr:hypothetical protein [Nitrosomonas mobilis]SCZ84970.1 exported hypothetical protein [Nitrosomonas mobilis]
MHSQKIFVMTIACIIAFTATPLVAAENIAGYSSVPGNLLLA